MSHGRIRGGALTMAVCRSPSGIGRGSRRGERGTDSAALGSDCSRLTLTAHW